VADARVQRVVDGGVTTAIDGNAVTKTWCWLEAGLSCC
jgi:hypothetical protein